MLEQMSEKKSLIYFASGLRLNGVDNIAQLHATIDAAVRAGVSFWPVDARGLVASAPLESSNSPAAFPARSTSSMATYHGVPSRRGPDTRKSPPKFTRTGARVWASASASARSTAYSLPMPPKSISMPA